MQNLHKNHKYSKALTHNDLTWHHILWDSKNKQINIIDFSDRAFGDPAIDFGGLYKYGNSFAEEVFGMYSGKKDKYMLKRALLYFKRAPLSNMKNALKGKPRNFEESYLRFKKTFNPY